MASPRTPSSSGTRAPKRSPTAGSFTPIAKRSLFSPSWKSPTPQQKGKLKEDLAGYVVFFSESISGEKNTYHFLLLNTAANLDITIIIMDMGLRTDFKSKIGDDAVKLSNVSRNGDGKYFYNEKYGASCSNLTYKLSFPPTRYDSTDLLAITNDRGDRWEEKPVLNSSSCHHGPAITTNQLVNVGRCDRGPVYGLFVSLSVGGVSVYDGFHRLVTSSSLPTNLSHVEEETSFLSQQLHSPKSESASPSHSEQRLVESPPTQQC